MPDGISVHRRKAEKENDGHSDEFRREHWEGGVGLGTSSDPGVNVGTRVVAQRLKKAIILGATSCPESRLPRTAPE